MLFLLVCPRRPRAPLVSFHLAVSILQIAATEVPEHRQGQLLIRALGGQARKLFDGMTAHEKQYGVQVLDAHGREVRLSAVDFIFGVIVAQFPAPQPHLCLVRHRLSRPPLDFPAAHTLSRPPHQSLL